jgi:hypothetical protein
MSTLDSKKQDTVAMLIKGMLSGRHTDW